MNWTHPAPAGYPSATRPSAVCSRSCCWQPPASTIPPAATFRPPSARTARPETARRTTPTPFSGPSMPGPATWFFPAGSTALPVRSSSIWTAWGSPRLAGRGTAEIVMAGPGPAFRIVGTHQGTADPHTVQPNVWQKQRMPTIDGLGITGDHDEACRRRSQRHAGTGRFASPRPAGSACRSACQTESQRDRDGLPPVREPRRGALPG